MLKLSTQREQHIAEFKNVFYTPIFLLQMASSFDKGRF
jgi:hypothetical protein